MKNTIQKWIKVTTISACLMKLKLFQSSYLNWKKSYRPPIQINLQQNKMLAG